MPDDAASYEVTIERLTCPEDPIRFCADSQPAMDKCRALAQVTSDTLALASGTLVLTMGTLERLASGILAQLTSGHLALTCGILMLDLLSSVLTTRFANPVYLANLSLTTPLPVACASRLGPEAFTKRPAFDKHTSVFAISLNRTLNIFDCFRAN